MNQDQRRITLRVALFWAAFWALLFVGRSLPLSIPPGLQALMAGVVITVGVTGLVMLFARREGASLADMGMAWQRDSIRRFVVGTAVGMAIVGVMLAAMAVFTSLTITRVAAPDLLNALGFSFVVILVLATMEEIAFRSYPLVRLREACGVRTAIYVTSLFFAAYHGLDPMNLLGPGVWGLLFGLAAVAMRGLALPLGIHFGLNWMQSLFGLKPQFATSVWMASPGTGGGLVPVELFGVVLQVVVLAIGVVLIERHVRRGG